MKTLHSNWLILSILMLGVTIPAFPQGTAFIYHGRLIDNGGPANGSYDLTFSVFDAPNVGNQVGSPLTNTPIGVTNGIFTALLDFGPGVFTGPDRWLEMGVRTNGVGYFTLLSPRQRLTPTPYAIMANTASNLLGALPAGQLSGLLTDGQLPAHIPRLDGNSTFTGTLSLNNPANTFVGHGSSLTALNPANLSPGTAAINISGNAATATAAATAGTATTATTAITATTAATAGTAVTANNFSGLLAGDVTGSQGATVVASIGGQNATSVASGASAANAATAANTADALVRRDSSGNFAAGAITANSFIGDGSGLTALNASQLISGTLADTRLSTNVALLNAHQTFSGSNAFSGVLNATNMDNTFVGTFSGNGAGLTGLSAGSLVGGILPDSRLSTNVALLNSNPTFSGAVSAASFAGNGGGLSNLNATSLAGLLTVKDLVNLGHINNGGFGRAVAVAGQYAYLANEFDGLRIYDISDPAHPIHLSHTNDGNVWGVAVAGQQAYLANAADGLRIYDISNPANPINVGHTNNGGLARCVAISGNYAYLANYDDGLRIYNVADSANPINVARTNNGGLALGVAVAGNFAYLANDADGLRVYNIANPNNPINVGHAYDGGMAKGVAVAGEYAFLANGDDGLRIYNISNPANPVPLGHIDNGGQARAVAVAGNYAYLANLDDGLRIYDITDPANPIHVGHIDNGGLAQGVVVAGKHAFLANGDDGLRSYALGVVVAPGFTGDGSGLTGLDASSLTNGTLPAGRLAGVYVNPVTFSNLANSFAGNGGALTNLNAETLGGLAASDFWQLGGNAGTIPGVNFLGTTDTNALELKVDGQRALRLEPTIDAPNLIGGSSANYALAGSVGATISGGGSTNAPNGLGGIVHYGGGQYATIGGGSGNLIHADYGMIGGGSGNWIRYWSPYGVIGGGTQNSINDSSKDCTIGGGARNSLYLEKDSGGTIGGGEDNHCETAGTGGGHTISGGLRNTILGASYPTIGGGADNAIGSYYGSGNASGATIGGGWNNSILASGATIAGGAWNKINDSGYFPSPINRGYAGTIAGGVSNVVNGAYGSVGGGAGNAIQTNANYATVSGGLLNEVAWPFQGLGLGTITNSSISGGYSNKIWVANSVISGGVQNQIGLPFSFLWESGQTIGGGSRNVIGYEIKNATISGGADNFVDGNSATIAGGSENMINWAGDTFGNSIGGGSGNYIAANPGYSVIGGGKSNRVTGEYSVVPGGFSNSVSSVFSFAAGRRAQASHQGTFVWADSTDAVFATTANNQFNVRASGGVRFFSNAGLSAGVSLAADGTSWAVISDRNVKKNFQPVDSRDVLERLAALPIRRWNYQWESDTEVPHLGPMAQDFKAAFYPGRDDKSITTQEADGVALAAIQGLNQKLEEKEAEIQSLQKRLEVLERAVLGREMAQSGGGQ